MHDWFYGLLDLPWWGYVLVTLGLTHITIVSVTIFLHRHQAHRALELHPALSHFFRFWLWITTGMVTKQWVAIHRKHHARVESEEDPHSPVVFGIKTVLWEGADLYRAEAKNDETLENFGHATPDDKIEKRLYSRYSQVGIFLMLGLDILLMGVPGVVVWAVQMAWIPFFAAGVVNGLGHWWGYRNFEVADTSTNLFPIGILIGGEELHNNHHSYGSSAKFSVKWYEFDVGWLYIKTLSALGLAKVKKTIPQLSQEEGHREVDDETLKAIVLNRLQLLSTYYKQVMVPAVKSEKARLPLKFKKWDKKLLHRDQRFFTAEDKKQLDGALEDSDLLQRLYSFKTSLQEIWARQTPSQKEIIDALRQWCQQAEASGIKSLQEFVAYLKGCRVSRAASSSN